MTSLTGTLGLAFVLMAISETVPNEKDGHVSMTRGGNFTLECTILKNVSSSIIVRNSGKNRMFTYDFNTKQFTPDTKYENRLTNIATNGTKLTITLLDVNPGDEGVYTCCSNYDNNDIEFESYLLILTDPNEDKPTSRLSVLTILGIVFIICLISAVIFLIWMLCSKVRK